MSNTINLGSLDSARIAKDTIIYCVSPIDHLIKGGAYRVARTWSSAQKLICIYDDEVSKTLGEFFHWRFAVELDPFFHVDSLPVGSG